MTPHYSHALLSFPSKKLVVVPVTGLVVGPPYAQTHESLLMHQKSHLHVGPYGRQAT